MEATRLIGRSAAAEQVVASVTEADRSGCLLVGETGMGKTAVAQAVANDLKGEYPVFSISGTPALSRTAFAVLAPFLAGLEKGVVPSQESVFQATCRFFRLQRAECNQIPILVVDDAHDVDPGARTILARMVTADIVRLIVLSARSLMPLEFMELWTDGFLGRCDLNPLSPEDVHVLCETVLQGQVLRSVSALLMNMSQGNPSAVTALLRQGRASGRLLERNGVWLAAELPSTDMPFSARLGRDLRRLPRDEYELLEIIALAEPVPLEVLAAGGKGHCLDALNMHDLVTISDDVPRFVRLRNPAFADVVRRTVPPVRSSELQQEHGDLAEDMTSEQLLRRVSWALECGAQVPPHVLVRAARAGNEAFDFPFTLRAAAALQESAHLDEMWLEQAIAHTCLGHHVAARDRLERLLHESDNLPVLLRAALWICLVPAAGGDRGQQRRLNILLAGTAERVGIHTAAGNDKDAGTIGTLIKLLGHMAEGRTSEVEKVLNILAWHTPDIELRTRVVSLALLGNLQNAAGRFTPGRKATSLALDLVEQDRTQLRMEFEYAFLHHVKGLLLGGQWEEAAVRLADFRRNGSRNLIYSGAPLQLLEGTLAVWQGKVRFGLQELHPAIEGLRQGPHAGLVPFGLGMMAYAAALCGEAEVADECIESIPPETACRERGFDLMGKAYALAATAVIHRTDDAGQQLSDLATQAEASGLLSAERAALALAMRLGHPGSAGRLAQLTASLDGPVSEVLQLSSRAVMGSDADALLEAAARASREGYCLVAVNCAEQAAMILDADKDRGRRNAVQLLLRQYRTLLDGPFILGNYDSSRAGRLTSREREIVELAQGGQSNREIARTLSLSTRTVEGHFYRIFAKLGVNSRAELLASAPLAAPGRACLSRSGLSNPDERTK